MSLKMQLRRTVKVIMTHDYWTLALKYHSEKYQIIYESVYSYLCTCMRNKYSWRSEFVWNVRIQVMLKVIIISILDQHAWACWDMVETWFNFGGYAGICHLPLASLKELHLMSLTYTETPWLELRGMIKFPGMVTHVTH